jgi:RNA polymerase sigma-70 factor, ECF subfamily
MTDDDLVVAAKTDRSAFGQLYDRYYGIVNRYCVRRLFDRTVADDVVSDVFLTLASKLRAFAGTTEIDFRRWLFRIATNAVNAHLRQAQRRRELWEIAARQREERLPSENSSPGYERLDWPAVYQAILELEERDQAILTLRFFAGLSHEEIADVLDATPGAVRTALSRTLSCLRKKFNPASGTDQELRTIFED